MAEGAGRPLTRDAAFWDTSALVPLCVGQGTTPQAVALYESYDVVVWWSTPIEMASALARLLRMKQLSRTAWAKALKLAEVLAESWSVIQPSNALRTEAVRLVNRYHLRAANSLQLAAALEWCENASEGRVFLTADEKLREAALFIGFDAKRISTL